MPAPARAACHALRWRKDGICTPLVSWDTLSPWVGFSRPKALAAFCKPLRSHCPTDGSIRTLVHCWRAEPPQHPLPGAVGLSPPPPSCSLSTGRFAPILQACRCGAPQGWWWCVALSPGGLEYFVIDIVWRIFAYFGNLTSWKEMSSSATESLHASPAGFQDSLRSSDFRFKFQSGLGGFLGIGHQRVSDTRTSPGGFPCGRAALRVPLGHSHLQRQQGQEPWGDFKAR